MRLNGWQRIGVILSVVWVGGAFYNGFKPYFDEKQRVCFFVADLYGPLDGDWQCSFLSKLYDNTLPPSPHEVTNPAILPHNNTAPARELSDEEVFGPQAASGGKDAKGLSDEEVRLAQPHNNTAPAAKSSVQIAAIKALGNLLPVPVTWFVIYLIIGILRWIRAGFAEQRNRNDG